MGAPNVSILSEVERLRQENQALRSENAELRGSPPSQIPSVPPQIPMVAAHSTECGFLANGISPNGCQQDLRFGAPLRYMVIASPVGMQTGHVEVGFDASDAQNYWRCN